MSLTLTLYTPTLNLTLNPNQVSGQRMWTELGHNSKVYEQTQRGPANSPAQAPGGFHFGAKPAQPFQFGGDIGAFSNGGKANGD